MANRLNAFIPRSRSKWVFVVAMTCYGVALTYLVGVSTRFLRVPSPTRSYDARGILIDLISSLLVAPLFESLILIGAIELIRRLRAPDIVQVVTAAMVISLLHGWPWWPKAAIVLPSFCIDAASYLYWRRRTSWRTGYWVIVAIHALSNFTPVLASVARALQQT